MPDGSHAINRLRISDVVIVIFLILLCLTCVLPFIHLLAKSISADTYVVAKKVSFIPKGINFDAYRSIFKDGKLVYSFIYTVIMTLIFTALGMVSCIAASYPLSRKRLKGRGMIAFLLMIPMYFSAGLIPQFVLMKKYNLIDSMWVLIWPLIYSPYNMLIMKNYFQANISDSLEESAFLDGATNIKILWKIVLPLSKPILATISLFYAVGRWNAYADAKYYIKLQKLMPVQLMLSRMVSSAQSTQTMQLEAVVNTTTPEILQSAAIMFVTIPIICIYPFLQKYFVKGVMIGAVKG
ncbi:MAG: carbohydrate ABC transporter permease [Anaerolineaceae bacterium]|nr:MAG: carbohydrate ABC transporter permease [Anaerolineaceae bacterium]